MQDDDCTEHEDRMKPNAEGLKESIGCMPMKTMKNRHNERQRYHLNDEEEAIDPYRLLSAKPKNNP